jgi:hypothetical protein
LSASRRFYNYTAKEYNTTINVFPSVIIAKIKGHQVISYFEVENETIKNDIEMKFN